METDCSALWRVSRLAFSVPARPESIRAVNIAVLTIIDSNRLRYYIQRDLWIMCDHKSIKHRIFNLKERLDEQDNRD